MQNRQTRKRLATRQKISDIASLLFIERGFDAVKIEEIAEAADVSRMTVFNHFSRKEDLFFDLDQVGREDVVAAVMHRRAGTPPVEALRLFAHRAIAEKRPYVRFFEEGTDRFMATIQASEALKARARAIRDELTDTLADALARSISRTLPDPSASLAASLVIATWEVALFEAHRILKQSMSIPEANAAFLLLIDQGTKGVQSALEGTAYL